MKLLNQVRSFFVSLRQFRASDWWVEIMTAQPKCVYYFGPFERADEAKAAYTGYVEDLEGENAQGIYVQIKRCNPTTLTICGEGSE